jgi:NAD(P)-dependent dehydrogenase (short-subunit alcohol dehydrogenase family)
MSRDPFDLTGRVAVVTGASRGIGEAAARLLAAHGARVIVSSRRYDGSMAVARQIESAGGVAEPFACHIGDLGQIEALFKHLDQSHGRIDILVNNAATNPFFGHVLDTELAAFEKTVDVNLRGYFYMSVYAGRRMREQGGGSIINVASVNGVRPAENQGIYSITKAAVISMTRAFARECGPFNIRVNALVPGLTETRFAAALHADEKLRAHWLRETPLGRIAQPQEMAGAVLYLASDAASYTTGSCLVADGGLLSCPA